MPWWGMGIRFANRIMDEDKGLKIALYLEALHDPLSPPD
jgi:hypothetical protein